MQARSLYSRDALPVVRRRPAVAAMDVQRVLDEASDIGYWSADIRSDAIHASVGLYRILGLDPSRPLGFPQLRAMMHPDDRTAHSRLMTVLRTGHPIERRLRFVRPDSTLRWVSSRAEVVMGPDSKPSHAIGVIRDITGRHDHGSSGEDALDRFEALIKATAAVLWVVSPDGGTLSMPQWETLTGQPRSEHQGLGWLQAVHPDDRERTAEAWRSAVNHAAAYNTDYRLQCADGIYRWFNSRGTPILNPDGSVREWVGVLLSIPGQSRFGFRSPVDAEPGSHGDGERITPAQIRAGRGIAGLSFDELARRSNLSVSTVRRMENEAYGHHSKAGSLSMVRRVIEEAGVTFTFDPGRKPGVCPA